MVEFMVLSAPRSASTWAANWLTTEKTLCLHDPVLEHYPEDLDTIACDRVLGVACTGLALLPDFLRLHQARKVIIHRPTDQIDASLEAIGLTKLGPQWETALDRLGGYHVLYEDLFDAREAASIYEYLTRQAFDAARHEQLCGMHVEPNFEKVKIKPDRARAFRDRITRAFS
jgi:hypothetical protein